MFSLSILASILPVSSWCKWYNPLFLPASHGSSCSSSLSLFLSFSPFPFFSWNFWSLLLTHNFLTHRRVRRERERERDETKVDFFSSFKVIGRWSKELRATIYDTLTKAHCTMVIQIVTKWQKDKRVQKYNVSMWVLCPKPKGIDIHLYLFSLFLFPKSFTHSFCVSA